MLLVVVGAITLALQGWNVIDVMMSLTDIWIWIAAALIGIAFNLLTRPSSKVPVSELSSQFSAISPKPEGSVEIGGRHFDSQLYLTEELGHLGPLLAKAQQRLWVMGVSLTKFAIDQRDTIPRLLTNGVDVRFLLLRSLNPDSKELDQVEKFVEATGAPDTSSGINTSLGVLRTLRTQHPTKLEVKQHGLLPFHSMVIVDDSFIQVGFYLYKAGPPDRPQAIVSNSLHPEIFKRLENSYEQAWRLAEPV